MVAYDDFIQFKGNRAPGSRQVAPGRQGLHQVKDGDVISASTVYPLPSQEARLCAGAFRLLSHRPLSRSDLPVND